MKSQVEPLAKQTADTMYTLVGQSAMSIPKGWSDPLEQHSPSRVLTELGRTAALSLTGGLSDGFGAAKREQGDRSEGCGDIHLTLNVTGAIGDPSSVGEALVQPVVSALARIYRRAAREG
jgi:hypothetical protein